MCEQTEINYLDGDVVWVKLGACWWPGQVINIRNLSEDIQTEFRKKPLIAAVKFFQEDTYEFVKNYQQIYKYNCTLKDEFIKKGLDKYRSKSKDVTSYMDKFPGDVEMAEKLTGGDPDILTQERFCPEEKPDISALFGEKRIPKKKRDREDEQRRSDGAEIMRKITHPRFVRENDHEVRIRQQPSSLPSTPTNTGSPVYRCHHCSFTSTRVNVIICHQKSHRPGDTITPPKIKTYSQPHSRVSNTSTPKRKYVRKDKSQSSRKKSEIGLELGKRKHFKQNEKSSKKKKTDPELREKLLADWDDESDDEANADVNISLSSDLSTPPTKNQLHLDDSKEHKEENTGEKNEILAETEKLLKETDELSSIQILRDSLDNLHASKNTRSSNFEKKSDSKKSEKSIKIDTSSESFNKSQKKKDTSGSAGEIKNASDKDDRQSRLSCFDFDEDDLSEPSIPPVRKLPRVFGEKSLSLKKEIIKEFEMSQALKNEIRKEAELSSKISKNIELKADEIMEIIQGREHRQEKKEIETSGKLNKKARDKTDVKKSADKEEKQTVPSGDNKQKSKSSGNEKEIAETSKAAKVRGDNEGSSNVRIGIKKETKTVVPDVSAKNSIDTSEGKGEKLTKSRGDKLFQPEKTNSEDMIAESNDNASTKEADDTLSERFTTETEDETVSESAETMPEQSENSDVDMLDRSDSLPANREVLVKRGRGRPRKNARSPNMKKSPKAKAVRSNKTLRVSEKIEVERKTSDSDTDRSYSGRRRKPNKKYLEPDIYVPDPDYRAFRTDESQSESETRASQKTTSRSRKNKRLRNVENKSDVVTRMQKHEIEISDRTPSVGENNVNASAVDTTRAVDAAHESNASRQAVSSEGIKGKSEEIKHDVSNTEPTKPLNETSPTRMAMDVSVEEMGTSEAKDKTEKAKLDLAKPVEKTSKVKEQNDLSKQDKDVGQHQKKSKLHIEQIADTADKAETQREIVKTNVDMLPPKKSQIKKFELSQIDFFDVHANKTAETESESEHKIKPESKLKSGLERKGEGQTDFEEKIDEENKVEVKSPEKMTDEIAQFSIDTDDHDVKNCDVQEKSDTINVKKQSIEKVTPKAGDKDLSELKSTKKSPSKSADAPKSPTKVGVEQQSSTPKKSSIQTRYKGKFTPETGKGKKDRDLFTEEKPANTFQEAFLKTLQIDKKKIEVENTDVCKGKKEKKIVRKKIETEPSTAAQDTKTDEANRNLAVTDVQTPGGIQAEGNASNISIVHNLQNVEIVVEGKVERDIKTGDGVFEAAAQLGASPNEFVIASKSSHVSATPSADNATIDLMTKLDGIPKTSITTASLISTDISVPVKKREMPRIIENVTLTEPVQILKTKLLDKLPQKSTKHKLDHADLTKPGPKTKIMRMDTLASNSKAKAITKPSLSSPHMSLTKKLQILKTEEANALANAKQIASSTQTIVAAPVTDKFIQQSPQSLADMELDINSMPFVLSEDVLTPESIEQMPVVISSIIPASSSIPATLTFTPTTQIVSPTQTQFKITSETAVAAETSPTKKKSGVPAILKNKSKARPTITSVKTLVPPLTGGVKGLKFQSTQPIGKTPALLTQKTTSPGKYVVVQTAGGQQLRYSVQGKTGTQQKIAISTGKTAGNAQVIQQGGKVVILTSGQSCQTKMVPLNISKALSGKVQRIVTSKGQLLCPISPQGGIITSKIIAPKADSAVAAATAAAAAGSPTTSKLATSGHKIINTQGIITSKGVLTPIPGTIAKTALLGTLSQGIITKGGIYTPISASALSGKIIGSKTLVTKGGTTLLSPQAQSLGGAKAILTPVSQAIAGKTILGAQAIVSSKGTILTPITGQQVKAIAAKSPVKGSKQVQYQQVQQKLQLPILQKSPKLPISIASSPVKVATKSAGGTLILQNTSAAGSVMTPKGMHGKKIIKQTVVQSGAGIQGIGTPSTAQQTVTMVQQVQPKGKTATVPKVIIPRSGNRQTKAQQKILVQKMQEPAVSTVQAIHAKQTLLTTTANVPIAAKTVVHSRQLATPTLTPKSSAAKSHLSGRAGQIQKTLLNVALNSINTATTSAGIATTVALPPLEPIDTEKKTRTDIQITADSILKEQHSKTEKFQVAGKSNEKVAQEPKIAAQPQIMALPTESSDGTQTYVLVTIDEQGQIQPLDNNALMSLEGTTQNPDGTRTLYIDPSSLGEAGTLDNIVLQFDNGMLPGMQTNVTTEANQPAIINESFPASEVIQTSNQDILAAALANTDFQQEINLPDNQTGSVMTQTGLTQTSLINQTILQSTIIPPTEPISSPSVLETSLTLNQPIMTPLEVPSSLPIQSADSTPASVVSTIPSSLELPITITNPSISYISVTGETQIQIPGNSMPDIGEIMESPAATAAIAAAGEINPTEIPASTTQYLVIPNLDSITSASAVAPENIPNAAAAASYTVAIPNSIVLESPQPVQTTPSMPIIDDTFADNSQFAATIVSDSEQAFADVTVSEMLVSKASTVSAVESVQSQDVTVTSEMMVSSHQVLATGSPQKTQIDAIDEAKTSVDEEAIATAQEVYSSQKPPVASDEQSGKEVSSAMEVTQETQDDCKGDDIPTMTGLPMIDDTTLVTSECNSRVESMVQASFEVSNSSELKTAESHEVDTVDKLQQLSFAEGCSSKATLTDQQLAGTSKQADVPAATQPVESLNSSSGDTAMEVDKEETAEPEVYAGSTTDKLDCRRKDCQRDEPSSQEKSDRRRLRQSMELDFEEEEEEEEGEATNAAEASQETPSQSRYGQFMVSISSNVVDLPSQSAAKLESSSGEATQSVAYEPMETDEEAVVTEPPSQSFEHSKINEASQSSYEASAEVNVNAPTQSFNEIVQRKADDEPSEGDEAIDDQSFPTQSYEVDKVEGGMAENVETDAEISQEGNIPSQSNDIGADGIGTSSVSTNNSGLNEDETASSSYVPETPENQERDQDQESAISTSSYEIPPCEELNIASSSVIPDTSVSTEHAGIHDNGVPEIPTSSSYNLNPDITSTHHVDSAAPSSSYEDQVIVEQNVSTSYEVPIPSMPGLEETCSQNFVTESSDHHRNEPSSYYASHHQEVTASYYESVDQDSANSRLEEDPHEEHVTPGGYYEGNPQEVSQSYFTSAEETPSYTSHGISPSYYDPSRPESEASQSYYPAEDLDGKTGEQSSSSPNIEASQSFYQEGSGELRLRQQGEATPTYTEGYPVDYTLENSPIERHDLVESSVPATRPMDR